MPLSSSGSSLGYSLGFFIEAQKWHKAIISFISAICAYPAITNQNVSCSQKFKQVVLLFIHLFLITFLKFILLLLTDKLKSQSGKWFNF